MLTLAQYTQDRTEMVSEYLKMNINPFAKRDKLIQLRDEMIAHINAVKIHMADLSISDKNDCLIHSSLKGEVYHMDKFVIAVELHLENLNEKLKPNYVYVGRA